MAKKKATKKKVTKKKAAKKTATKKTASKKTAKKKTAKKKAAKKQTAKKSSMTSRAKKTAQATAKKAKSAVEGRGTLIATAVGIATAAAAGVAAFKTFTGRDRNVFHLMPHTKGWQITKSGRKSPVGVFEKKQEARDKARETANKNEPSQLVIHRTDGTIQAVHTYGE